MAWEVEGTDEFANWFAALSETEKISVGRVVELLVEHGPVIPSRLYDEYLRDLQREGLT
jgi:hypothetical protein